MPRRTPPSRLFAFTPIASALVLAISACSQDGPPPEPPIDPEVLETVVVEPGISREALARAVDDLFVLPGLGETRAVVIMHKGEIVAERYADGYDPDMRHVGWSMAKTVTGVIIGMMVADGRLRLNDPAPVPIWQRSGDPRGEITLRHLLQMRSGLQHDEMSEPVYNSAAVRMMYMDGRDDMAAWAQAQPLAHEPGSTFNYSTPTSVILADIATDLIAPEGTATQRQEAMSEFIDARLAVPLDMPSLVGEFDASGTLQGGSSVWATARDWARFGEFMRDGRSASGTQIVPRGWIDLMRTPSPAAPDYGAQLWLNRDSETRRDHLFAEQGPDTAFALVGHQGQYVIVSPQQRLTVARLGKTDDSQRAALMDELAQIFALYPSG